MFASTTRSIKPTATFPTPPALVHGRLAGRARGSIKIYEQEPQNRRPDPCPTKKGIHRKRQDDRPLGVRTPQPRTGRSKKTVTEENIDAMKRTGNHLGLLPQIAGSGKAKFPRKRRDNCRHEWLKGADNCVCARCGYLLHKHSELPLKGIL